jgi:hypothetical protein
MKVAIFAAAALLLAPGAAVPADDDRQTYNRRASQIDMSLFRELDRSSKGFLAKEDTAGDLRLGPRFDDIDINRDGIVTPQEMRSYVEQTYGTLPAPAPEGSR